MFLHVAPDSVLAIYDQIVRQIKFAVATGALPAGEMVPSVRERCWKRPLRIERFNLAAASWTSAADRARLELLSRRENLEFTFTRSIPTRVLCNARSRERKRTESGSSSNRLICHESGKPFPTRDPSMQSIQLDDSGHVRYSSGSRPKHCLSTSKRNWPR